MLSVKKCLIFGQNYMFVCYFQTAEQIVKCRTIL